MARHKEANACPLQKHPILCACDRSCSDCLQSSPESLTGSNMGQKTCLKFAETAYFLVLFKLHFFETIKLHSLFVYVSYKRHGYS